MSVDRFHSAAATHAGTVRAQNQDAFVDCSNLGLWAVADGAGGHASGEVASRTVARSLDGIPENLPVEAAAREVRARLAAAHASLRAPAGAADISASTVVVLIARGDRFACLWAGDSRAYLLRDGGFTVLTRDHSLVQELVDAGAITQAQAERHPRANVITRAVGTDDEVLELDEIGGELKPGDRFLLCSDGLSKTLPESEIAALLAGPAPAARLLEAALAHQARDNVTVVTAEVAAKGLK